MSDGGGRRAEATSDDGGDEPRRESSRHGRNARGYSRLQSRPTRRGSTGFSRASPSKPGLPNDLGVFSGVFRWAGNLHSKTGRISPAEQGLSELQVNLNTMHAGWEVQFKLYS